MFSDTVTHQMSALSLFLILARFIHKSSHWRDLIFGDRTTCAYLGTTGGLFVCGPKPMLEAISNVLETVCFYLGNYITNFGNYIGKFVP